MVEHLDCTINKNHQKGYFFCYQFDINSIFVFSLNSNELMVGERRWSTAVIPQGPSGFKGTRRYSTVAFSSKSAMDNPLLPRKSSVAQIFSNKASPQAIQIPEHKVGLFQTQIHAEEGRLPRSNSMPGNLTFNSSQFDNQLRFHSGHMQHSAVPAGLSNPTPTASQGADFKPRSFYRSSFSQNRSSELAVLDELVSPVDSEYDGSNEEKDNDHYKDDSEDDSANESKSPQDSTLRFSSPTILGDNEAGALSNSKAVSLTSPLVPNISPDKITQEDMAREMTRSPSQDRAGGDSDILSIPHNSSHLPSPTRTNRLAPLDHVRTRSYIDSQDLLSHKLGSPSQLSSSKNMTPADDGDSGAGTIALSHSKTSQLERKPMDQKETQRPGAITRQRSIEGDEVLSLDNPIISAPLSIQERRRSMRSDLPLSALLSAPGTVDDDGTTLDRTNFSGTNSG